MRRNRSNDCTLFSSGFGRLALIEFILIDCIVESLVADVRVIRHVRKRGGKVFIIIHIFVIIFIKQKT